MLKTCQISGPMGFAYIAFLLALSSGCGPQTGTVSGVVKYNGVPLPGGLVMFRPEDESVNSVTCVLEGDGKFVAVLPVGAVKVCVDNREFEPTPPTTPPKLPGMDLPPEVVRSMGQPATVSDRWVKIPEKYYQLETTDLTFEVVGSNQSHDIELAD